TRRNRCAPPGTTRPAGATLRDDCEPRQLGSVQSSRKPKVMSTRVLGVTKASGPRVPAPEQREVSQPFSSVLVRPLTRSPMQNRAGINWRKKTQPSRVERRPRLFLDAV